MACLALALVYQNDQDRCLHYQEMAAQIDVAKVNECIEDLGEIKKFIQVTNKIDLDISHLQPRSRCALM